jgi:hypothetical protein
MRSALLLFFAPVCLLAQPFSAGIKAGIPLSDFVNATDTGTFNYTSSTQRYIVGGMAEVRLPLGLGVEFDALYRNLSYSGAGNLTNGAFTTTKTSAGNWEFPLVLKYRFHFPVVRPYVEAGVAWDTLTGIKQTASELGTTTSSTPTELRENTTMGFVLGGGVDIHAIVLHISPEIRYTRWDSAQINSMGATIGSGTGTAILGGAVGPLRSNLNQAEFLVGITF